MIRSIADLLAPHDPQALVSAMLEKRRLHLRTGRPEVIASLLPWERFATLPSASRLSRGEMRVMRAGCEVPQEMMVPRARGRTLSPDVLQALCHQGASIVLNGVERHVPAIAALNAMLERWLRCRVWTNCYAGFAGEGAFPEHYDPHDVLVLQLHGSKRWFFHGQPYVDPVKGVAAFAVPAGLPVEAEAVLMPGDVLFLPRGEVHRAEGTGEATLHLSIGLTHDRGGELLQRLIEQATGEAAAREDVNALAPPEARAAQAERLAALLRDLADRIDIDALLGEGDARRDPMRPLNLGLSQTPDDAMIVQPALRRGLPIPETGLFKAGTVTVALEPVERSVLQWLLDCDGATVSEAMSAFPHEGEAIRSAIASLARKSLVFVGH